MKNFIKTAIFAAFVGFTACTADSVPTEPVEIPEVLEEWEFLETAENHATEPISAQEQAEQASQSIDKTEPPTSLVGTIQVPFTVNGTADFELTAFLAYENATPHFLLQDIAEMLDGTQAQFDVSANAVFGDFRIERGQNFTADIDTIRAIQPRPTRATDPLEAFPNRIFWEFTIGTMDFLGSEIGFLETPQGLAFSLESFARFFGFSVEWQVETANGVTNLINTHEPTITEYGRAAVSEFLYRRPTLFIDSQEWTNEILAATNPTITWWRNDDISYIYPNRFILYDLNNSGIPDILLGYLWEDLRGFVLYSYINGEYQRVGMVGGWYEFFRDSYGQIFLFNGNHHSGWETVQQLIFSENGVIFENVITSPFGLPSETPQEEHDAVMWEWGEFWEDFHMRTGGILTPVSPVDPTVPTISIRPLSALQAEFMAIFLQEFSQPQNLAQPQALRMLQPWQLAYADILRHY
ncbi:MAG: hypothetical protein FWG64_00230 [Firmicutes bacterium]|nr:hypothetical protein [Bacillota bacterium]